MAALNASEPGRDALRAIAALLLLGALLLAMAWAVGLLAGILWPVLLDGYETGANL